MTRESTRRGQRRWNRIIPFVASRETPSGAGWTTLFLVVGTLSGIALAVATPPFEVPDEIAHFERAYEISEGRPMARPGGSESGDLLPASVPEVSAALADDIPFHPDRKISPETIRAAFARPLEPGRRTFVAFSNSALTSPLPYVPSATGIAVCRLFTGSVLALFYAGRIANLAAALALTALAIRLAPFGRPLFFLIASTPMISFERSSLSSDAFTDAIAMLVAATALHLARRSAPLAPRDVAAIVALAAALGLAKSAYLFLVLLFLLIPTERFGSSRRRWLLLSIAAGVALGCAALWASLFAAANPGFRLYAGTDPETQLRHVLSDPIGFVRITVAFFVKLAPRLAVEFIGRLGWLDVPLPRLLVASYAALLLLVAATTGPPQGISLFERATLAASVLVSLGWMSLLLYLVVSRVGSAEIGGIQGRHLVPLAAPAFLALSSRLVLDWGRLRPVLTAAVAVSHLVTIAAVCYRYYG